MRKSRVDFLVGCTYCNVKAVMRLVMDNQTKLTADDVKRAIEMGDKALSLGISDIEWDIPRGRCNAIQHNFATVLNAIR